MEEIPSPLLDHGWLFVDAGVEGRSHRVNLVNPNYREVGEVHGAFQGYPYSCLLICNFGTSSLVTSQFFTGVVYDDRNQDGIYTAGEGIEKVVIRAVESAPHAWTSDLVHFEKRI